MKLLKKYVILLSSFTILTGGLYFSYLYLLPPVLTSHRMQTKYEQILSNRFNLNISLSGLALKTHPNFYLDIKLKECAIKTKQDKDLLSFKDFEYKTKIFSIKPQYIKVNRIYLDTTQLPKISQNKKANQFKFDINYMPQINIHKAYIKFDNHSYATVENFKSQLNNKAIESTFLAKVKIPYVKDVILIGQDGKIIYPENHKFYIDNLSIQLGTSKLFTNGNLQNLSFAGKNLSIGELEKSFLYFYKLKHPKKKNFIENFHNMTGQIDVNLMLTKDGLVGNCLAKNLNALFFDYKIPISLPITKFVFTGREITAKTSGTFGGEAVHTNFYLRGLGTKDLITTGSVYSPLTNNFTKKYYPLVKISKNADASVRYKTHNGVVDIDYNLKLPKGSDLITKVARLNNTDKTRIISAKTQKIGDKITLKKYSLSFDNQIDLITGNGLFLKNNGHYKPDNITLKTKGQLPVSLLSSVIHDYLNGGKFSADLSYKFPTKTLFGSMDLYDVTHKDYLYLEHAKFNIEGNDKIILHSKGTFFNSPIYVSMIADNNFRKNLLIHDINIHLKKYIVAKGNLASIPKSYDGNIPLKTQSFNDYKIEVEKGQILVDEIYHRTFTLHDVRIIGQMKDNIVNFIIPETNYAKGQLSGKGKYDVKRHASDIYFFASDIDSNEVATNIFNFKDQINGSAFATLHLKTKDKLNDIKAHATFAITDGYLPQLGSTEFMVSNSNKHKILNKLKKTFTLSKITNIDFSKSNIFYSNLRGSFLVDNNKVRNVKIYSQSDYLSLFIEGDYDVDSEHADFCIWGRHNKTEEKKIRIFKIPLTLIYRVIFRVEKTKGTYKAKLAQIPPIKIKPMDIESIFKVSICGNLNEGNVKVQLKDLR